ncbi:hypothetical protein BDN71DRAFT_1563275 [Pleurotus eryngii]|uniref:Uncharacterized protein n=1 Tax=Pleurotus eryngii TaxID=5323 RepID=A0A9P5ZXS4_PLEER|nr:hypothetical protein BDN71DRAFT_1563275 [Pleurotus eryngii]
MHQAALAMVTDTPPPSMSHPQAFGRLRARKARRGTLAVRTALSSTELQKRVQALEVAGAIEQSSVDAQSYSEEQLVSIYEDLLSIPTEETPTPQSTSREQDLNAVNAVDLRLLESDPDSQPTHNHSSLLNVLQLSRSPISLPDKQTKYGPSADPYKRVLWRIEALLQRLEAAQARAGTHPPAVSLGVLTGTEGEALVRVCVDAEDLEAAEYSLSLMKRLGVSTPEAVLNCVLEAYASKGLVFETEQFLTNVLTAPPTETQRHLHVKAHLRAVAAPETIPESALSVLHHYESHHTPAPMNTYTMLITNLFSKHSVIARAQAWDIFTHMRYVAHPNPDAFLYTMMIRACASPFASYRAEAERALDLWTEMTVDKGLSPTVGAYNAVILACARSGELSYINEAFRLAKQMLDAHRDAHGNSQFRPNSKTFCALLEGAKRVGDLNRARWILAEMVRVGEPDEGGRTSVQITEEAMMHLLHTYTAYTPPFRRGIAVLKQGDSDTDGPSGASTIAPSPEASVPEIYPESNQASFTHLPPQSRAEVIAEVQSLFSRIQPLPPRRTPASKYDDAFASVTVSTRLVNSYISVFYRHSSLQTSRDLFNQLFEQMGVKRNARSYTEALTKCVMSKQGADKDAALGFAMSIWDRWLALEHDMREEANRGGKVLDGRIVEKARTLMIRILTLHGKIDEGLDHVRSFVQDFPPPAIRTPRPWTTIRGTRTVLFAPRPLVRATTPVEIPDDTVPPLLTFGDVDVLHHRLVALGRGKDIGYLKWVVKSYEGALRTRREKAMKEDGN